MAQMQQADVRQRELDWRTHVWGSNTVTPCPICSQAANIRQSCDIGRGLNDQWVRSAQQAFQELGGGA